MAGLRELRARLRSIQTTGQMAGAMRTAATAKYFRLSSQRGNLAPYSEACRKLLSQLGSAAIARECEENRVQNRNAIAVFGGHRGLCGGFNSDLQHFFQECREKEAVPPLLLVGGRKMQTWFRENGLEFEPLDFSDIPTYAEAQAISQRLTALYTSGEVKEVRLIFPRFCNMLMQQPTEQTFLPTAPQEDEAEHGCLILPDEDTLRRQLSVYGLDTVIYEVLVDTATGSQAATMTAMRSACDNAQEAEQKLSLTINRRRQAEVTSGVIETASGMRGQGEEV